MPSGDDRGTVFWFRVQLFVTLAQMDEVIQGTFEIRVIILTTAAGRSVIRANCRSGVQGEGMKRGQFGFLFNNFSSRAVGCAGNWMGRQSGSGA
jgi:hypothetical protein